MVKYSVILLLFLSSCSLFNDYSWIGIEEIETMEEALIFMNENISYRLDYQDYWQFPEETFNLKTGDCEDTSALLAHILIYNLGLENVRLIGCIRKSDRQPHMVVKVGDRIFESAYAKELFNFYDEFYQVTQLTYENYIDLARLYHL